MTDYIDKIKQGISKGVTQVSVKSREIVDIAKLKNQISTLEQVKHTALDELGHEVYDMYLAGTLDVEQIKQKGYLVGQIDDQIRKLEDEMARVHQEAERSLHEESQAAQCPCGADLAPGMKFCGACGRKVEPAEKPEDPPTDRFCSQCGERLEQGAQFCQTCGTRII